MQEEGVSEARMASHGRGRGVRRNFEAGKETKVRIGRMKGAGGGKM